MSAGPAKAVREPEAGAPQIAGSAVVVGTVRLGEGSVLAEGAVIGGLSAGLAAIGSVVTQQVPGGTFLWQLVTYAATLAIFGVCNWAYQWWRPGGRADPAHTAQKMWDLIIRGLTSADQQPGPHRRHPAG